MAFQAVRMLVVGIGLLSAPDVLAQQYTLTIHSEHVYFEPQAINTAGQVVGSWGNSHAFLWSDGTLQDLGQLPGTSSCIAMAINDSGQVVGSCSGYPSFQRLSSFLWTADTGMMALPIPGWSWALGINNQGHIVGWRSDPTSGAPTHAFLYRDGVVEDLGAGSARGINDQDQVVGYGYDENGLSVARLWDDAGAHDLDDEGGSSVARAIRADGVVAGASTRGSTERGGPMHAVLWSPYGVSDLGTLGGSFSVAFGMNGDLVVGYAETASHALHAFVYDLNGPGYPLDLNDLIAPSRHRLRTATGINAAGQIVGEADCCGETEFFLLTSVGSTTRR